MDCIRPWLYIGKYAETLDETLLFQHHIRAKLHLAASDRVESVRFVAERSACPELTSLYLPVEDGCALPETLLRQGLDFVFAEKEQGKTVLISCGAGISRSATFAVAAIKESEEIPLLEALRFVKRSHPQTRPHPALWESLCAYYHERVPADRMLHALRRNE